MQTLSIFELTGRDVLGGAVQGESLLALLISAARPHLATDLIVLDFAKVEVATSSYLRTSALAFRRFLQSEYPGIRVVFANISESIRDELLFLLGNQCDALVACQLVGNELKEPLLVGQLEEMQLVALRAVIAHTEPVDAKTLAVLAGDSSVEDGKRFTKWNNRLASLAQRGILRESSLGRTKFYAPIVKGLACGT